MERKRKYQELTDREWLLLRPHNIIGSVQAMKQTGFLLQDDGKFLYEDFYIVPAFLKICNEIIDNSVDVFIDSNGKSGTKIDVNMTSTSVKVKDNGFGIPVRKEDGDTYLPEILWGRPRAGSNFDDDENREGMGMNGVGSYATAVFSKKFVGTTCDGKNKIIVKFFNNLEKKEISKPVACKTKGTTVEFHPDIERFSMKEIPKAYMNIIKQRLINLSFSYPGITFKFNGEVIKVDPKSYFSRFGDDITLFQGDNYSVAIMPNETDDFRFLSYVNGLHQPKGGSNITYFLDRVIPPLRDKLLRRHKGIKIGDIKNKMTMIVIFRNFRNPDFEGQVKEEFTSTPSKITTQIGKIDFAKWGELLFKNKKLTEPIVELYKAKEEIDRKKKLKEIAKPKKRIDSEKYYPANGKKKYLMICEGESASGGLMPGLGSDEFGYFELKGKPLNAYDKPQKDFINNPELTELYNIMKTEGYEYYIDATDQDLDGYTIRGLLLGFFERYSKEDLLEGRVGSLQTPIIATINKNKLTDWAYNLSDEVHGSGYKKYFKGMGTWKPEWLTQVIKKDGIMKMIRLWEYDEGAEEAIDSWLNTDRVEDRKIMLRANDFDLIKV